MSAPVYDVVVVGGGPIGLSTAYQCAKAGKSVILLEQEVLYNAAGSSADYVRMFRTMYTEDYMADLAHQTMALWKDLEAEAGEGMLIWMTGLLNFGDPNYSDGPEGNLTDPIKNLKRLKMPFRQLNAQDIEREYPLFDLPKNYVGLFAPDNGCINVPLLLRSLAKLCGQYGVRIVQRTSAKRMELPDDGAAAGVVVFAEQLQDDGTSVKPLTFFAHKAAITTGAYINHLLRPSFHCELDLTIWEMVYEYYALNPGPAGTVFPSMWFQFADPDPHCTKRSNLFYGFPAVPWGPPNAARIAVDNAVNVISDPVERRIAPASFDLSITAEWVKKHVRGVSDTPFFSGACLQTNVFDNMFVLDFLPSSVKHSNRVVVFTAGWAMKFVPTIGVILKDLLTIGTTPYNIEHFKIDRRSADGKQSVLRYLPDLPAPSAASRLLRGAERYSATAAGGARAQGGDLAPKEEATSAAIYRCYLAGCTGLLGEHLKSLAPARLLRAVGAAAVAPLRVGIMGAGVSGLYAALLLQSLDFPGGIHVDLLEADHRLGGRLYTHRFSDDDPLDYVDFGAMRIPEIASMDRVIGSEPWSLKSYLASKGHPLNLGNYSISDPNTILYFNGQRCFNSKVPSGDFFRVTVQNGGDVPNEFADADPTDLFESKVKPFLDALKKDFYKGALLLNKIDHMTTRQFLQQYYPNTLITWMETRNSASGLYDKSIAESIVDDYDFSGANWKLLIGGMSQVAEKMEKCLVRSVSTLRMGHEVTKLEPLDAEHRIRLTVVQHTATTATTTTHATDALRGAAESTMTFDHVISTITNARFRMLQVTHDTQALSYGMRTALRTLHYDHSTKVAMKFKTRWWQRANDPHAIHGGASNTDLPIRTVVYPTLGDSSSPGVLIVSYTWAQDADRMGTMSVDEVRDVCLRNLAELHKLPIETLRSELVATKVVNWSTENFTQGAFALFGPAQFSTVYREFVRPAAGGRLHFAGEAASHHHAWIAGALDAAYRSVVEILKVENMQRQLDQLRQLWGSVVEVDALLGEHPHPLLQASRRQVV